MRFALILSLLIALVAVVFATYNAGPMDIAIPFTDSQLVSTKPVVLISTLLLGVLIGVLASMPGRIGAGMRARKAEKRLAEIDAAQGTAVRAEAKAAEARAEAATARREAVDPEARAAAAAAEHDAAETQRLADEVARRTETLRHDTPPPTEP